MTLADSISELNWQSQLQAELPLDPSDENTPRQVFGSIHSRVQPETSPEATLICSSSQLAQTLDLNASALQSKAFLDLISGNTTAPNLQPYSTCYGGHQFGHWAGQLGDGRAINLGETVNSQQERWFWQLKGAGPTPYSRTADGYAVLRSSIREFLCSEAMHHLGIPTTRALSLVGSGKDVLRDILYDGHARYEPGAIVCRVARSFLRFGHFQLPADRGDTELLKKIITFAMANDTQNWGAFNDENILAWFTSICERSLDMVLHWQRVGFVHGVLNTDNMSIIGDTIDYGPYGWLEEFDLGWTPNTTDAEGKRYCFGRQPSMVYWNCQRLAEAIAPTMEQGKKLLEPLENFKTSFPLRWSRMMLSKQGLEPSAVQDDSDWLDTTLTFLSEAKMDFTRFHRQLSNMLMGDDDAHLQNMLKSSTTEPTDSLTHLCKTWLNGYHQKLHAQPIAPQARKANMDSINPHFVLRNYLSHQAIEASEQGDHQQVQDLLDVCQNPYNDDIEEKWLGARPEWAIHKPGCSMLSCSS